MRKIGTDKKTPGLGLSLCLLLFLAFLFLPREWGSAAALVLTGIGAVLCTTLLRRRRMTSVYFRTAVWIAVGYALVYRTLLLLSGLRFGFFLTDHALSLATLGKFILPYALTIVASEIVRGSFLAERGALSRVMALGVGLLSELLMQATLDKITNFYHFMNFVGMILLPALAAQLLYQYTAVRFGVLPAMLYRLIVTLSPYVVPIKSGISDALASFIALLAPVLLWLFLRLLFEKKEKRARPKGVGLTVASTAISAAFVIAFMMLISCQFRFCLLVIATDSMTGEINKGDAIIYEKYEDQSLDVDDIVVFEKNDAVIVHRIVDVSYIDGETRYVTKGDVNETPDAGYITKENLVGITRTKLPYVGYPTLLLHDAFKR